MYTITYTPEYTTTVQFSTFRLIYLVRRNRAIFRRRVGIKQSTSTISITSNFIHYSCYFWFAFFVLGNGNRQIRRERSRSRNRRHQRKWKAGRATETLISSSCLLSFQSYQYFTLLQFRAIIKRVADVLSVCCRCVLGSG